MSTNDDNTMTFRPSPKHKAILKALSVTTGKSNSAMIREAVDQYLAKIDTEQLLASVTEHWQQQQRSHEELVRLLNGEEEL
jgi:predicted DNA-binding protein